MSAYNKINGVPCAQNRWLLEDVLRKEWGFDGFVVTDWSAAYDQVEACAAGNDLVMPGPRQFNTLVKAVENKMLKEEDLDECVRNFLKIALETPAMKGRRTAFDMREGIDAAKQAAKEGITLLKNNGVLPLKKGTGLAFYGECSKQMIACGAGSAAVNTSLNTSVYAVSYTHLEILGFGGLAGCGMHEVGRMIFGLDKTVTGEVVHVPSGTKITRIDDSIRHNIGYVSKDRCV